MAARHILLHSLRWRSFPGSTAAAPQGHRLWCSATSSPEEPNSDASCGTHTCSAADLEWKEKEKKIVRDIQPIVLLTRSIFHSYMNGEHLSMEDERGVVENVLIYHPEYEDIIGSGLNSIMVDRHHLYVYPRCLFVVRTDGTWIYFSYRVCIEEYIKNKYQISAERFANKRFLKNLIKRSGI